MCNASLSKEYPGRMCSRGQECGSVVLECIQLLTATPMPFIGLRACHSALHPRLIRAPPLMCELVEEEGHFAMHVIHLCFNFLHSAAQCTKGKGGLRC